ncbi:CvpA family protein [Desulfovibrio inopinatus]|uniref:CvpA family protein n=1 Tax=Desulfovibrio inopinatus TaxID=102109 RepID=UPI0004223EB3|nr:CvpA family protein [Desulfovibrio inopinatus]
MSVTDIVVIVIWLFFAIRGFLRGLVSEAAMIVSLLAGFYGANSIYHLLIPYTSKALDSAGSGMTTYTGVISYALAFLGILLVALIITAAISRVIHLSIFHMADSVLGALAGLIKGAILTSVLFILVTTLLPDNPLLTSSRLLSFQQPITQLIQQAIPQNMLDHLHSLLPKSEAAQTP